MIGVFEMIALAGYLVALAAFLYGVSATTGRSSIPLQFLAGAMLLMVFVSASNTLEHLGVTGMLDPYEDYAEILFLPLVAYGLYGYLVTSQDAHIETVRRAVESEHHMLLEIVENAPVGIAIVDVGGRIAYANPEARTILRLEDDDSIMGFASPGRVRRASDTGVPEGILTVNPGEHLEAERCIFEGRDFEVPLLLSATPLYPEPPHGASIVMFHRA